MTVNMIIPKERYSTITLATVYDFVGIKKFPACYYSCLLGCWQTAYCEDPIFKEEFYLVVVSR